MTTTATLADRAIERNLGAMHILLTVQSAVIALVSINRLAGLTTNYVASNEFLRWVDLNNMLVLPLISLLAFYLLKKHLEQNADHADRRWHLALNLGFLTGVYLVGVGYGLHEVTNYLHARFCLASNTGDLCRIVVFNDDEFSHWLFFLGFVLVNTSLLLLQALFPRRGLMTMRDGWWLVLNGLCIGVGIFANLAFEPTGIDLYVVALLVVLALGLLWRRGAQPLFIYYAVAYGMGLLATGLVKAGG